MAVIYSQNGVIVNPRNISLVAYSPNQSNSLIVDKNGYIGVKQPAAGNTYFAYIDPRVDYSQSQLGQVTIIIPEIGETVIGDKTYKTTKIGTQTWLAENLDLNWEGLVIGSSQSSSEQRANYYNNNESIYGWTGRRYGLLYNTPALEYLINNKNSLIPGWHVPSNSEYTALINYIGVESSGITLRSTSNVWGSPGVNAFEFSALPSGDRENNSYLYDGVTFISFSIDKYNSTNHSLFITSSSSNSAFIQSQYSDVDRQFAIRLVRDSN